MELNLSTEFLADAKHTTSAISDTVLFQVIENSYYFKIRRKTLHEELVELIAKANNIAKKYARAKSHQERHLLAEEYFIVCEEIRILKKQIESRESRSLSKAVFKVAAALKKIGKKYLRNLRSSFRNIMRFLFKNMDDNSGDVFFSFAVEKPLRHNKISSLWPTLKICYS